MYIKHWLSLAGKLALGLKGLAYCPEQKHAHFELQYSAQGDQSYVVDGLVSPVSHSNFKKSPEVV